MNESPERNHLKILSDEEILQIKQEYLEENVDIINIGDIEKQIAENPDKKDEIINKSIDTFLYILKELSDTAFPKLKVFVQYMYQNKILPEYIDENEEHAIDIYYRKVIASLEDHTIDKDHLLGLFRWHRDTLLEHEAWITNEQENLTNHFISSFISKINPLLTFPIQEETLKEIFKDTSLKIMDILEPKKSGEFKGINIIYLNLEAIIGFEDEDNFESLLNHIFNHEALHAVSAGKYVSRTKFKKTIEDDATVLNYHTIQIGEWNGVQISEYSNKKFLWLNEAITETLTSISTDQEPIAYKEYIELFDLVCIKGLQPINKKVFYDAYFEKKGHLRNKESDINLWKDLMVKIEESYPLDGRKFLVLLDDIVREKGVEHAIGLMNNWDPEHPVDLVKVMKG